MRSELALAFAGLFMGVGVLATPKVLKGDRVLQVKERLDREGMPEITVLGVCSAGADSAVCWKPNGEPDESLSKKFYSLISSRPHGLIILKPGKKNRWVLWERPVMPQTEWDCFGLKVLTLGSGRTMEWRQKFVLEWVPVIAPMHEEKTSLSLILKRPTGGQGLAVMKGSKFERDGAVVRVTSVRRVPKSELIPNRSESLPPVHEIVLEISGQQNVLPFRPTPIGKSGEPIVAVDGRGNPVKMPEGPPKLGDPERAQVNVMGAGLGKMFFHTNVNPKAFRELRFPEVETMVVEFTDLPLDPKSPGKTP